MASFACDIVYQYDIIYDIETYIVYDISKDVANDVVYDIYSCTTLAEAAKRRRFKISAPLTLVSATCARCISSAPFTEIFLGSALP